MVAERAYILRFGPKGRLIQQRAAARIMGSDRSVRNRLPARVQVGVAVTDDVLPRLPEVAEACRLAGLHVESTLSSVGVLIGTIEVDRLEALRAIPGVAAVEFRDRDSRSN